VPLRSVNLSLRRYLKVVPGARPHLAVDRHAPLEEFERIADQYPVFHVTSDNPSAERGDGHTTRPGVRGALEFSAHMTVRPGQLEGFKQQAAECIRLTREKDTGALRYDLFLGSDGTQCEVGETYLVLLPRRARTSRTP
jgi:hypothetical protein